MQWRRANNAIHRSVHCFMLCNYYVLAEEIHQQAVGLESCMVCYPRGNSVIIGHGDSLLSPRMLHGVCTNISQQFGRLHFILLPYHRFDYSVFIRIPRPTRPLPKCHTWGTKRALQRITNTFLYWPLCVTPHTWCRNLCCHNIFLHPSSHSHTPIRWSWTHWNTMCHSSSHCTVLSISMPLSASTHT